MEEIKFPKHAAIIMDGNRRWAKERGLDGLEGHREGLETLKRIAKYAAYRGVKFLTVFAFAKKNWSRSRQEVECLFSLFHEAFDEHLNELSRENIGITFMGDRLGLPRDMQDKMRKIESQTCNPHNRMTLVICLNYSGRDEVLRAFKELVRARLTSDHSHILNALDNFEKYLDSGRIVVPYGTYFYHLSIPDVDLVIRTSDEQRTSDFLIWQASDAELYFSMKYWPAFTETDFDKALEEYSERDRRFGV